MENELESLRITVESMKNASNTHSINNMVNSENTSGTSMKDGILNDVLTILRAEIALMNKKLQNEVSSAIKNMNGGFVKMNDKGNDTIKADTAYYTQFSFIAELQLKNKLQRVGGAAGEMKNKAKLSCAGFG